MKRTLLIKVAKATIPLLRLVLKLAQEKADETSTELDDTLATLLLTTLDMVEELLSQVN